MQRRRMLALLAALMLAACSKVHFKAPESQLDDGVFVEIDRAFVRGSDRVFIEAYVSNNNKTTLRIDVGDWALKLPTGELVARRLGASDDDVYVVGPGMGQAVSVDFRKEGYDLRPLTSFKLIIGGIQIGESSTPYVVGEIVLTRPDAPAPSPAPSKGDPAL